MEMKFPNESCNASEALDFPAQQQQQQQQQKGFMWRRLARNLISPERNGNGQQQINEKPQTMERVNLTPQFRQLCNSNFAKKIFIIFLLVPQRDSRRLAFTCHDRNSYTAVICGLLSWRRRRA